MTTDLKIDILLLLILLCCCIYDWMLRDVEGRFPRFVRFARMLQGPAIALGVATLVRDLIAWWKI